MLSFYGVINKINVKTYQILLSATDRGGRSWEILIAYGASCANLDNLRASDRPEDAAALKAVEDVMAEIERARGTDSESLKTLNLS